MKRGRDGHHDQVVFYAVFSPLHSSTLADAAVARVTGMDDCFFSLFLSGVSPPRTLLYALRRVLPAAQGALVPRRGDHPGLQPLGRAAFQDRARGDRPLEREKLRRLQRDILAGGVPQAHGRHHVRGEDSQEEVS